MKNVKSIIYLLVVVFAMTACTDDDTTEEPSKITAVRLGTVSNFTGPCSKKFDFEAEIDADGPTTISYTWLRSDGATAPKNSITFEEAGTKKVTTSWTLGENGESYEGYWQQLKIISPEEILSNKAEFDLHCEEETVTITAITAVVGENNFTGPCSKKFDFEAEIHVDGPTTITYTWLRSDGATAPENSITFEEAGTKKVTTSWTLGGSGESYEGYWQQLKVIAPEEVLSERSEFNLYCEVEENVELVSVSPTSPSTLFLGEKVGFTFNYITSSPTGARIFGRPFTSGSPTPGYAAHGSPIHDTGEGSSNGYFTIQDNPQNVDQIRFQMWDADQSNLLYEFYVDVDYKFISHSVVMETVNPASEAILYLDERVEFTYSYRTNEPTGVRIFGRPMTDGSPTPGYAAHGSQILSTGDGTGSGYFTLTDDGYHVDQIRFRMYNAAQTTLLYEYFVEVDYKYLAHRVVLDNFEPSTNSVLVEGERVNFNFHYKTNEPSGVRIFGRPFTYGNPTPGYAAHPSGIYPMGEGNGSGYFTVSIAETITPHTVDQVRFQMWDADQNNLLYEYFVDVDYVFTE
ncbi:hypothetical protein [Zobellia laminariae]|uniref:hypothetical protein n=3 Tax=Zobellia laminariae TaxID=248906 RepID=UPI0026F44060|nr:hypothetical protein [Zobellia laminariae]WKX77359.1 hypothetical protein Q5W13_04665 [Zobellia laminariae]